MFVSAISESETRASHTLRTSFHIRGVAKQSYLLHPWKKGLSANDKTSQCVIVGTWESVCSVKNAQRCPRPRSSYSLMHTLLLSTHPYYAPHLLLYQFLASLSHCSNLQANSLEVYLEPLPQTLLPQTCLVAAENRIT